MKVADRVKKGIPDIILCVSGVFVALELKRSEKEKATPLQIHTLSEIRKAGGAAWVVSPENWEGTWKALTMLANEKASEEE